MVRGALPAVAARARARSTSAVASSTTRVPATLAAMCAAMSTRAPDGITYAPAFVMAMVSLATCFRLARRAFTSSSTSSSGS
jgi:hypothetical protein